MPTITLHGRTIPYQLVRSGRNRHVRLTVSLGKGLRVSAPARFPAESLQRIIHEKSSWVLKKLDEFERIAVNTPRQEYRDGATILFAGKEYLLRTVSASGKYSMVRVNGDEIRVTVPVVLPIGKREEWIRDLISVWMRVQAQTLIPERVRHIALLMSVFPGKISIKKQKTRWGSCSAKGNLNFNQRLVMLPPELMDYVIIHELAHIRELNHSPRYWRLVDAYCEDRKHRQKLLKRYSYLFDAE